ncbi:hypothetical protein J4441_03975 [Candidatus Micrarchaeota archaeon]|nr:hypothetical protein [Candidatus Micrarchaeota archaeon]
MDSQEFLCRQNLNKRWQAAAKILFNAELGPLEEYKSWLCETNDPVLRRRSSISNKPVSYVDSNFNGISKYMSFDEIDFNRKFSPLSINDVKDMDSIVSAVQERIFYAGNIILGNSQCVYESTNINDSFYMLNCAKLGDSKYIAHCTLGRLCEGCFGCNGIGESKLCLKCHETYRDVRSFELWRSENCSDCYYSYNLSSCSDCMYSFNMQNKRFAIGNLVLPAEKYAQIKKSLLLQMAQELQKNKRIYSLVELAAKCKTGAAAFSHLKFDAACPHTDLAPIQSAFEQASKVILGKPIGKLGDYTQWLEHNCRSKAYGKSAISGSPVIIVDYSSFFEIPRNRLVKFHEALKIGEIMRISEADATRITLENAHEFLGNIAFFPTEYEQGTNQNTIECATTASSSNCYRSAPCIFSKYCAYCFWPRTSEHLFGCSMIFDSSFCMNSYYSLKLRRCLEMDSCRDCSDSLYCHNLESSSDSMFCFNSKNLRNAIGNAQLPREKYSSIKSSILAQLAEELQSKKSLKWDIYSIGSQQA